MHYIPTPTQLVLLPLYPMDDSCCLINHRAYGHQSVNATLILKAMQGLPLPLHLYMCKYICLLLYHSLLFCIQCSQGLLTTLNHLFSFCLHFLHHPRSSRLKVAHYHHHHYCYYYYVISIYFFTFSLWLQVKMIILIITITN